MNKANDELFTFLGFFLSLITGIGLEIGSLYILNNPTDATVNFQNALGVTPITVTKGNETFAMVIGVICLLLALGIIYIGIGALFEHFNEVKNNE